MNKLIHLMEFMFEIAEISTKTNILKMYFRRKISRNTKALH